MTKMKYIVYNDNTFVLIPQHANHSDVTANKSVHSAGFCQLSSARNMYDEEIIEAYCYGRSTTLQIDSDPEHDMRVINSGLRL